MAENERGSNAGPEVGGATGAVVGGAIGSIGGPVGTVAGAAIGAAVGGGAGDAATKKGAEGTNDLGADYSASNDYPGNTYDTTRSDRGATDYIPATGSENTGNTAGTYRVEAGQMEDRPGYNSGTTTGGSTSQFSNYGTSSSVSSSSDSFSQGEVKNDPASPSG